MPVLSSILHFVDLAGSEKARLTGAEGQRLKEGGHINKSLLSLTTVISKLADGDRSHVPFRDSKLTRILQSSLSGNTNTAIICAITPASDFLEESVSTLKFAARAKTIEIKPKINEIISDKELIRRLTLKIKNLEEKNMMSDNIDEEPSAKRIKTNDLPGIMRSLLIMKEEMIEYRKNVDTFQESLLFTIGLIKTTLISQIRSMEAKLKYEAANLISMHTPQSTTPKQVDTRSISCSFDFISELNLLQSKLAVLEDSASQKLKDYHSLVNSSDEKIKTLEAESSYLLAKISDMDKSHREKLLEVNTQNATLTESLLKLSNRLQTIESETLSQGFDGFDKLSSRVISLSSRIESMCSLLSKEREATAQYKIDLSMKEEELSVLRIKYEKEITERSTLTEEIEKLTSLNSSLHSEVDSLRASLKEKENYAMFAQIEFEKQKVRHGWEIKKLQYEINKLKESHQDKEM